MFLKSSFQIEFSDFYIEIEYVPTDSFLIVGFLPSLYSSKSNSNINGYYAYIHYTSNFNLFYYSSNSGSFLTSKQPGDPNLWESFKKICILS